jgi:hypothetical protein
VSEHDAEVGNSSEVTGDVEVCGWTVAEPPPEVGTVAVLVVPDPEQEATRAPRPTAPPAPRRLRLLTDSLLDNQLIIDSSLLACSPHTLPGLPVCFLSVSYAFAVGTSS